MGETTDDLEAYIEPPHLVYCKALLPALHLPFFHAGHGVGPLAIKMNGRGN